MGFLRKVDDYLFHGGLEDDVKDVGRKFDDAVIQPVLDNPALLLPVLAPGIGSAIGGALGLGTGALGSAVGSGLIGGVTSELSGGDFVKGALGGAISPAVGGLVSSAGLTGLPAQLATGTLGGGLSSVAQGGSFGQGALGGLAGAGINAGAGALTNSMGLTGLPANLARGAITGGLGSAIRGGDFARGALAGGIGSGTGYAGQQLASGLGLRGVPAGIAAGLFGGGLNTLLGPRARVPTGTNMRMPNIRTPNMRVPNIQPTKAGFQQWRTTNKISDPGTQQGRNAILQQYINSLKG